MAEGRVAVLQRGDEGRKGVLRLRADHAERQGGLGVGAVRSPVPPARSSGWSASEIRRPELRVLEDLDEPWNGVDAVACQGFRDHGGSRRALKRVASPSSSPPDGDILSILESDQEDGKGFPDL